MCHNILRSVCSKASCRGEDGTKPEMVIPFCDKPTRGLKRKLEAEYETEESDAEMDDITDDEIDGDSDEDSATDELTDDQTFKTGDYVKIVKGDYEGWFATVLGESYGGNIEIQYFEKKDKWWVIKPHDKDPREPGELQKLKIDNVHVDGRSHVYFK